MNLLHRGDNLDILRQHVKDASVDLTYLDRRLTTSPAQSPSAPPAATTPA